MRALDAATVAALMSEHVHEVLFADFFFDEPVFVHSGVGIIQTLGRDYVGVGDLGSVSPAKESEALVGNEITLTLSKINVNTLRQALEAGRYRDPIILREGYRNPDGTLVAEPWIVWSGRYEHSTVSEGQQNAVAVKARHDLADLDQADGSRFSHEDQHRRYPGDNAFEFMHEMASVRITLGGRDVTSGARAGGARDDGLRTRRLSR